MKNRPISIENKYEDVKGVAYCCETCINNDEYCNKKKRWLNNVSAPQNLSMNDKIQLIYRACPFLETHDLLIKIPSGVCAFLLSLTDRFVLSLLNYVVQANKIHG